MSTIYGEGFVADLMVTPWLSGHWKPVRVGCYERNYGPWLKKREPVPLRDWWDGAQWRYLGNLGIGGVCVRQNQAWRGLAQPDAYGVPEVRRQTFPGQSPMLSGDSEDGGGKNG